MTIAIRPARPSDTEALREIERRAGERFRDVGLDDVADDEPPSPETYATYAADGRAWIATRPADTDTGDGDTGDGGAPVGYVLVDVVDGHAHVEQISVHPDQQGAGVGRALLDRVRTWAAETGRHAVTLTTFSDVAWNRPLYEHLGFRVLAATEIGPELRRVRDAETAHGLDPATRVCMRLDVG